VAVITDEFCLHLNVVLNFQTMNEYYPSSKPTKSKQRLCGELLEFLNVMVQRFHYIGFLRAKGKAGLMCELGGLAEKLARKCSRASPCTAPSQLALLN